MFLKNLLPKFHSCCIIVPEEVMNLVLISDLPAIHPNIENWKIYKQEVKLYMMTTYFRIFLPMGLSGLKKSEFAICVAFRRYSPTLNTGNNTDIEPWSIIVEHRTLKMIEHLTP
jgi:hypothetical protein